jgi:hypothetical protein
VGVCFAFPRRVFLGNEAFHAGRFTADDRGEESYLKNLNVPMELKLKVDAQVVLLKNLSPDTGLVNGSRGVVIDFKSTEGEEGDMITCPVIRFENGAGELFGIGPTFAK